MHHTDMSFYPLQSEKIPIVIIEIPENPRKNPLINSLRSSKFFEIIHLEACMYISDLSSQQVSRDLQLINYGRTLSNGEIGCAISHNIAREIISKYPQGGVILEDDARIYSLQNFESAIDGFLNTIISKPQILSLLPWQHSVVQSLPTELRDSKYYRLIGETPLTVGYAMNRAAALELRGKNGNLEFLPDWPPSNSRFYSTIFGVITHGDALTTSVIDLTGRKVVRNYPVLISLLKALRAAVLEGNGYQLLSLYRRIKKAIYWRIDNLKMLSVERLLSGELEK